MNVATSQGAPRLAGSLRVPGERHGAEPPRASGAGREDADWMLEATQFVALGPSGRREPALATTRRAAPPAQPSGVSRTGTLTLTANRNARVGLSP